LELKIDYPPDFEIRYGYGKPNAKHIFDIINGNLKKQDAFLKKIAGFKRYFDFGITSAPNDHDPFWDNGWFPPLDGVSLYTHIATRKPKTFLEIGSGNSTKFARRAIKDHGLKTQIISIDPHPRAEIDAISDHVQRKPLEYADLSVFEQLEPGDVMFFDGSHRAFQNSDVTVFFTDVMPMVPDGLTIGIHDIFWPFDYPAPWKERCYNEQYMLGAYILGRGKKFEVLLPSAYLTRMRQDDIKSLFPDDVYAHYKDKNGYIGGSAFWFKK
jgi:hypothetical protein